MSSRLTTNGPSIGEQGGPSDALRLLFWLRNVAIGALTLGIVAVHSGLGIHLPRGPLALALAVLAAWNVWVLFRLRRLRNVSHIEVAVNLAVDIAAFTAIVYLTGGPTNPFVSLYLLPIALAATSLPARHAWTIGALCVAGYSLLFVRHVPLPSGHDSFSGGFDLHVFGMWVNFLLAAVLIVFFVGRMARLLRLRDREIAAMRETALRDQQIVALGTLAAGTAHDLNTPLSTLMMLIEEIEETTEDPEHRRQLHVMSEQIEVISGRLNEIARRVGADRSEGARSTSVERFLESLIAQWSDTHPDIVVKASFDLPEPELAIVAEATIEQAVRNVLDNAAHAARLNGRSDIEVRARCAQGRLAIAVLDSGAGIDPLVRDEIGLRVLSTSGRGMGIGLLLSRAALQRFGGDLELRSRPKGGVEARIDLPLEELLTHAR